uniref:Uncharacterized protein n=1 Tax=Arundo donax TaxID=35708 RepID=A0A0A9DD07_ARUDO
MAWRGRRDPSCPCTTSEGKSKGQTPVPTTPCSALSALPTSLSCFQLQKQQGHLDVIAIVRAEPIVSLLTTTSSSSNEKILEQCKKSNIIISYSISNTVVIYLR